jgi:hypothetical protein
MADTIIPLAVKTNAVILAAGGPQNCALARSLLRMTGLMRTKWASELPFSIINFEVEGRGLHSFPFQLNLSSPVHSLAQINSGMCPAFAQVQP